VRIKALLFAAAAVVLGAVAWLSITTIGAQYNEKVKNALRRMDRRLDLILAPERRRPSTDYVAFAYLESDAYTRLFKKLKKDQVRIPSPLMTHKPEFVQLHFQIDAEGKFSSPQVPTSNAKDIQARVQLKQLATNERQLSLIASFCEPDTLKKKAVPKLSGLWQQGELVFVRSDKDKVQGFWADWPTLRAALLEEITDLFPDATLERGEDQELRLLAIPAVLSAPRQWTRFHAVFAIVALLCLVAVVQIYRQFEKQRRFASHITHELRGPLTTFRLYHELLDEGLVPEEKRKEYYTTLRQESDRMAHLVENVIALSRLESGRAKFTIESVTVRALIERYEPVLKRVAPELEITIKGDATVKVDDEAVCQILANLVENAVKYGEAPITLVADGNRIAVSDAGGGPGANPFKPYERGRHEGTATRGLGLGLPLARMLAREMGGDLTLERPSTFVLRFA